MGLLLFTDPCIEQHASDGEGLGDVREVILAEPAAFGYLAGLEMNLARNIVCIKAYHQSTGIGPRLGGEVADVGNSDARFLEGLTSYSFLECLTCLHKACYETEEIATEILGTYQQHLVALMDEHDDGRSQLGSNLLATLGTLLGNIGIHAHGGTTDATELGVRIPIEQFLAFAGLEVERALKFVI